MTAHRATILAAGAAALALAGAPATAQVDDGIVLNIMRECARIDDPTARLACYDNNIRASGGDTRARAPASPQVPQAAGSAPRAASTAQGFGAETLRTPQQRQAPAAQLSEISAAITAISQRGPGLYAFTLEDGAQWQFSETVSSSYRAPRVGSTVEIERGALGSFLMRFDKQKPVAVRRTR
jgi:hypothetical protein